MGVRNRFSTPHSVNVSFPDAGADTGHWVDLGSGHG